MIAKSEVPIDELDQIKTNLCTLMGYEIELILEYKEELPHSKDGKFLLLYNTIETKGDNASLIF